MEKMIQELCLLLMFLTGWEVDSRERAGHRPAPTQRKVVIAYFF